MKTFLSLLVCIGLLSSCIDKNQNESSEASAQMNHSDLSIAYNVLVDSDTDNYEIFTMNMDGSNKLNVSNLPGVEWTYDSYGSNLYFISDQDTCKRCYFLYRTDHLGAQMQKVSDLRLSDSWMGFRKDGEEIIVKPHSSVDSVFLIINQQGDILQRLETGLPGASDPIFVKDGKQVAFRGGTKKSKREEGYQEEIYLINADGTGLKQLSQYPAADTTAPWYAYKAGPPHLHPTENFISYASYQNGKYSLYGVTLDGEKQWKLTENERWEVYHDWSPDGKWLVTDLSNENEEEYVIGLINWETKELTILTDTNYDYQQSPNFVWKG